MSRHTIGNRAGCIVRSFFGCSVLLLFFIVMLVIITTKLPEFSFSERQSEEYNIEYDSLSNEKIIKSSFTWAFVDNELQNRKYTLNFKLLERDVKSAMNYIDELASMKFKDLGLPNRFDNPETEARVVWAEVYRRIYDFSVPQMKSVSEGFNKVFAQENLDSRDRVVFVITFIQNITYGRPEGVLDLFPPIGTIAYRYGDCDSKALLLYTILEKMGIDCAMLWSFNYKHAMLGINVTASGNYLTRNGKKYYFLETTYPNWNIGDIPPEFNNKRYWFIDEIDATNRNEGSSDMNSDQKRSRGNSKPVPSISK